MKQATGYRLQATGWAQARFCGLLLGILAVLACSGCATLTEWGKGFLGVSTKAIEDKRQEALRQSFAYDYAACYGKVKQALEDIHAYIYSEDKNKQLIAIYVSQEDTTPVGIFLKSEAANSTLLEVASPSKFAKELIAKKIFMRLEGELALGIPEVQEEEKGRGLTDALSE